LINLQAGKSLVKNFVDRILCKAELPAWVGIKQGIVRYYNIKFNFLKKVVK
jgi:hypothetical protein